MPACIYCEKREKVGKGVVYQDDTILAFLADKPAAHGHIILISKEHYPIFENVPDGLVSHMFIMANKLSMALFETLSIQGTNIILENGTAAGQEIAHFSIHVIPRYDKDGMNFQWKTKQFGEEEMAAIEAKIKDAIPDLVKPPQKKDETPTDTEDEDNYLIRQLDRMP